MYAGYRDARVAPIGSRSRYPLLIEFLPVSACENKQVWLPFSALFRHQILIPGFLLSASAIRVAPILIAKPGLFGEVIFLWPHTGIRQGCLLLHLTLSGLRNFAHKCWKPPIFTRQHSCCEFFSPRINFIVST